MTLKEILRVIANLTGQTPPRIRLPHWFAFSVACFSEVWASLVTKKEPRATLIGVRLAKKKMFFSIEKAKCVLGFNPRPPEEALRDAIEWFRGNGYLR